MGPKPHVLLYRAAITAAKDALMDQWFPDEKLARLLKETDSTQWKDLTASILNIRICKCPHVPLITIFATSNAQVTLHVMVFMDTSVIH